MLESGPNKEIAAPEKQVAWQAASAKRSGVGRRDARPGRSIPMTRCRRALPFEPEPMDEESEKALENLEEHLVGA